jgi:peroxiredoxin
VSLVILAVVAAGCSSAQEYKAVAVGAAMPEFTLKDHNGESHTLSALKGKIVVLDFSSQHCPWSLAVDKELPALAAEYAGKDVVFFGIDSHKSTPPEEIKKHVEEAKIPFPVLKDEMNAYADKAGASRTPEFYVLDKELKVAYHGAYDNRRDPNEKGSESYVKAAIDSLLAGQPVATPEVKGWGCTIKRAQ